MVRGSAPPNRWLVGSAYCEILKRQALVRTSQKESAKDEAWKKTPCFVPFASMTIRDRRQGSAMNAPLRGAPLTPLPDRGGEVLAKRP